MSASAPTRLAALLGAALAAAPAAAQEVLPEGHAPLRHEIAIDGLDAAPEGTRFVVYPATAGGVATVASNMQPLALEPGVEARLYAVPADAPDELDPEALAELPRSEVTFTIQASVPEARRARNLQQVYAFEGIADGVVELSLKAEQHYDANDQPVAADAVREETSPLLVVLLGAGGVALVAVALFLRRQRAEGSGG